MYSYAPSRVPLALTPNTRGLLCIRRPALVIQSHYLGDCIRLTMKWEYAAFEQITGLFTRPGEEKNWPTVHSGQQVWWVLRSDRSESYLKLVKYKIGKSKGQLKSWEGALYANRDPFLLFKEASADGWEMTSSIPVGLRTHFDTGAYLGGYNMMPMMRRRLQE